MHWDPCKATIIIKSISLPLAWPASEYFEHKGDFREFNVCLSFKAVGGKLLRSRLYQRVNRTVADLKFDECFTFNDLSSDFTIEVMVSAKRVDTRTNTGTGAFSSVSRSFGKKFGAAFKKYKDQPNGNYTISAFSHSEDLFRNVVDELFPVARCFFRIENAGLSGKIRVYSLRLVSPETIEQNFNKADLLPLFGTMCCQVVCRPESLKMTLIRSMMDIFYIDEELLLEKLNCSLEGGCLKCYTRGNGSEPGLILPIDQRTIVSPSAYQTSIRLTLVDESKNYSKQFMLILKNPSEVADWISAIRQQICDAEVWGDFASNSTNPHALKAIIDPPNYMKITNLSQSESMNSRNGRTMTNTDQIKEGIKDELLNSRKDGRKSVRDVFKEIEVKGIIDKKVPPEAPKISDKREKPKSEKKKKEIENLAASNVRNTSLLPEGVPSNVQKSTLSTTNIPNKIQKATPTSPNAVKAAQRPTDLSFDSTSNVQKNISNTTSNMQKLENTQPQVPESKKEQKVIQKVEPFRPKPPERKLKSKKFSESSSTAKESFEISSPEEKPKMKLGFQPLDNLKNHERADVSSKSSGSIPKKSVDSTPKDTNSIPKKAPKNTYVIRLKIGMDSDNDTIDEKKVARKKVDSSSSDPANSSLTENRPPENQNNVKKIREVFEQKTPPPNPQPRMFKYAPLTKSIFKQENLQKFETEVTRL
ncbi:hypothetical protein FO519_001085 [Halicephalobus sp. NKZ332]|nr:hypothetical protein FO519_001085 [Halicephalobus sp. NKZ332]